jgi:hypothetical protein
MHYIIFVFFLYLSSALAVDNIMLLYAASSSSNRRSKRKSRCEILPHILGLEGKQCPNPNASPKSECPILPWNLGIPKEDIGYDDWWHQCSQLDEVPMTIGYIFVGMLYLGAALAGIAKGLAM